MDWTGLLTFATLGVGLAFDFSSVGETHDAHDEPQADEQDYYANEATQDVVDFASVDASFDYDQQLDEVSDDGMYAHAEFPPEIDLENAVLPWGDPEIDSLLADSDFTLGTQAAEAA